MQAVVLVEPLLTAVAMRVARLVLLEPMLTIVHGRVAPVVLVEPLLTAVHGRVSRLVLLEPLVTVAAIHAKHVLAEPILTAMHAKHVLVTNTALPEHIVRPVVLTEPMLTAVVRRVAPVVLLEPLLTAVAISVARLRIVLLEPMLTAVAMRVSRLVLAEPLLTVPAIRAKHVLLEPMLPAMRAKPVFPTNTALSAEPIVWPFVLSEPLLTAMRVSRLRIVLAEPLLNILSIRAHHVLLEPMMTAMRVLPVLITNTALPAKPVVQTLVLLARCQFMVHQRVWSVLLIAMLTAGRSRVKANFTKKLRHMTLIVVVIIGLLLSRRKSVMRLRLRTILH